MCCSPALVELMVSTSGANGQH